MPASAPTVLVIDDSPTILKVVQLVLSKAGYRVLTAEDGEQGIALATRERPELILLDFVMPRMNGYQVCRAIAEDASIKDVPVVLMSAKGDQVGERFVKVMGIVDYITKPFSPEAITAVVQHTIAKYGAPAAPAAPTSNSSEIEISYVGPPGSTDETTAPGAVPRRGVAAGSASVARRLDAIAAAREVIIEMLTAGEPDGPIIAERVRSHLDDASLDQLLSVHAPAFAGGASSASLEGNLADVPIAEVLTLLQQQRQWGTLAVTRPSGDGGDGEVRVEIHFKNGKIDLCTAEGLGEEFLVGRYLVDQQALPRQDLELFLRSRDEGATPRTHTAMRKPMGAQLIKLGYCAEADVKAALARQAQERIYEVLRWPAGRFTFVASRELAPLALDAALGLDIDGILMEGFRRVDEWHLIEREIDDFDAVYLRNEEAVAQIGKARLTREELSVLDLVNGKSTVKDIVRQSKMGSFEVSKMLFRLLSIKLIRRRVSPVAV